MQKSLLDKKNGNKVVYYPKDLMTVLALERTILAKQRTTLAEISVLLGITGLGSLLFRFYDNQYIKVIGALIGIIALVAMIKRYKSYVHFKKTIKKIDRKNGIVD